MAASETVAMVCSKDFTIISLDTLLVFVQSFMKNVSLLDLCMSN